MVPVDGAGGRPPVERRRLTGARRAGASLTWRETARNYRGRTVPPLKVTCAIVVNGRVRVHQGGQLAECRYQFPE